MSRFRNLPGGHIILLAAVTLLAGFFLWRYWERSQKSGQLFECRAFARGNASALSDCLRYRYGWSERDVAGAYFEAQENTGR